MRKLIFISTMLFGLIACFAPARADPVYQSSTVACVKSAIYDASTNGSTKLVGGNATQQIYVCGFSIMGSGTVNVDLTHGTGGTCGTGTTKVTPAWQLTAQAGIVDHQTYYAGLPPVPVSNDLCINASAGVAVQAIVYYSQF
jgi:hypothetical protein